MNPDPKKISLAASARAELAEAVVELRPEILSPVAPYPNVVGLGVGVKWTQGQPTGKAALIVLVTHKLAKTQLAEADLIPSKLGDLPTDVLAVGYPFAGMRGNPLSVGVQTLATRLRPVMGGYSVGHFGITAGTVATCVYELLPGGGTNPPEPGVGVPGTYYLLSNNHVLANTNAATLGDPILQPGPYDGGVNPADIVARLSRYIPIDLTPAKPLEEHRNLVDAAVAAGNFADLSREIYWNGYVRGWRPRGEVAVGTVLKKTGRTTHFTTGRVTVVDATIEVNYGEGRVGRFNDQIITTPMSAGGDSGSLVLTLDNVAVGLLFAGSPQSTILNQIEHVRSLLRVEVAEQSL
ncbi:hypothetical protein BH24DEI2_BH24DEI2_08590 [soil metagenome]